MSAISKGNDPRKDSGGNWLKVEAGGFVEGTILCEAGDILSCDQVTLWLDEGGSPQWPYTGIDDPANALGLERRYRAFLPILVDGEQKLWSMGKKANRQFWEIADTLGKLKGVIVRIKRTGSGLQTSYTITQKAQAKTVPDLEIDVLSALGPTTTEEVIAMLEDRLKMPYEDIITKYGPTKKKEGALSLDEDDFSDLT